jgi:hypothetical protein
VSVTATAPLGSTNTVELAITPQQLFEVLADAESWPHWASVITNVTWTSPEPRGVGATRTVDMLGGIVGDEEYLVWEPFTRMAFRFNECSTKGRFRVRRGLSGASDPRRLPDDVDAGAAAGRTGQAGHAGRKPLLNLAFRRFLANLRRYTDIRFATSPQT